MSSPIGTGLALIAVLLTGAPALGTPHRPNVIWLELCDAAHPGRRIPLPLRRDREVNKHARRFLTSGHHLSKDL